MYKCMHVYACMVSIWSELYGWSGAQQARDVDSILVWCWASFVDGGPTANQHWVNISCLPGVHWSCISDNIKQVLFYGVNRLASKYWWALEMDVLGGLTIMIPRPLFLYIATHISCFYKYFNCTYIRFYLYHFRLVNCVINSSLVFHKNTKGPHKWSIK